MNLLDGPAREYGGWNAGAAMNWLWIGVALGLLAPWLIQKVSLTIAFEEKGIGGGFGYWLGMATLTVPLVVGLLWLAQAVL